MGRLRIVVIGSGFAGIAAAWGARQLDADVSCVCGRAGASALGSGACDLRDWTRTSGAPEPIPPEVTQFLQATAAPILVEDAIVATSAGMLRAARARSEQILAIATASPYPLIVPRVAVGVWDADAIAAALNDELRSRGGAGARAVNATLLRHVDEYRYPLADLAQLHDQPQRAGWLAERLTEALASSGPVSGVLLPPFLGVDPQTIRTLRGLLAFAIGEPLGEPGGAQAFRFKEWGDKTLAAESVNTIVGEAIQVAEHGVNVRHDDDSAAVVECDRVVLATGGMLSGGVVFATGEHEFGGEVPLRARPPFRFGVRIVADDRDVVPWGDQRPLRAASSLFGTDTDRLLLRSTAHDGPLLLRVGAGVDESMRVLDSSGRPVSWLFAAGDVVADRDRTVLGAVAGGLAAGRQALHR